MMMEDKWMSPGVWNIEQMDPDPFLDNIAHFGLTWKVIEDPNFDLLA